jgi:hypothetical protein
VPLPKQHSIQREKRRKCPRTRPLTPAVIDRRFDDIARRAGPAAAQQALWEYLLEGRVLEQKPVLKWPDPSAVYDDVMNTDYTELLEYTQDTKTNAKKLCANGVVCKCAIEWFTPNENREQRDSTTSTTNPRDTAYPHTSPYPYTGLFQRADFGILRLSTAAKPPPSLPWFAGSLRKAVLFPYVAIKCFRDEGSGHSHSGNLLFAGRKTGQQTTDFFAHCVASHMTETIAWPLRFVLNRFRRYCASLHVMQLVAALSCILLVSLISILPLAIRHLRTAARYSPPETDIPPTPLSWG